MYDTRKVKEDLHSKLYVPTFSRSTVAIPQEDKLMLECRLAQDCRLSTSHGNYLTDFNDN